MTAALYHLVIEHQTTRDAVRIDCDPDGRQVGWTCIPMPPPGDGWVICDNSPDDKTVWRRVRIADGSAA